MIRFGGHTKFEMGDRVLYFPMWKTKRRGRKGTVVGASRKQLDGGAKVLWDCNKYPDSCPDRDLVKMEYEDISYE